MCIRDSLSSGQVLHCPYEPQKAKLVVREMTDLLVLDLVDKGLVTDQMAVSYTHLYNAVKRTLADCLFQLFELRTIEGNAAVPVIHKRLTDKL